jgi:8-oxo-dGTP pyrophosphatase MutT (NUDIX family)
LPYYGGHWGFPSCHIEDDELPIAALVREVREEVSVEIFKDHTKFSYCSYRLCPNNLVYTDYFFTTDFYVGELQNLEPEKCEEISWFPLKALPSNVIPYLKAVLESIFLKSESYGEYDERVSHGVIVNPK